ncbi:MAG: YraN family protein [Desulfuromonadales bacterium]|nr:YraN family protein [Desulfuromonadales bacterium]MDT8423592.1 YraN family protein [Desulfuromonadales bacterium]
MTEARLALGQWGEDQAVQWLQAQGLRIVVRNYRTPVGEVDIIARDKTTLIFVEVKTRRGNYFGTPQEAVGPRKQRQIIRAAQWYLVAEKVRGLHLRFDVIAIRYGTSPVIEHIADAFAMP